MDKGKQNLSVIDKNQYRELIIKFNEYLYLEPKEVLESSLQDILQGLNNILQIGK